MENMPGELDLAKAMIVLPVLFFIGAVYFGVPALWLLGTVLVISGVIWLDVRNIEKWIK